MELRRTILGMHKPRLSPFTQFLIGVAPVVRPKMIRNCLVFVKRAEKLGGNGEAVFWIVQSNTVLNPRSEIGVTFRDFDNCMRDVRRKDANLRSYR